MWRPCSPRERWGRHHCIKWNRHSGKVQQYSFYFDHCILIYLDMRLLFNAKLSMLSQKQCLVWLEREYALPELPCSASFPHTWAGHSHRHLCTQTHPLPQALRTTVIQIWRKPAEPHSCSGAGTVSRCCARSGSWSGLDIKHYQKFIKQ
jgi:hypothetical protein